MKLLIWGAGGHAMVVADIARRTGIEIVGYLDDSNPDRHGSTFFGSTILGGKEQLPIQFDRGVRQIVLAFGNCQARLKLAALARSFGYEIATLIHPSACIASNVAIGAGTQIIAGAVINPGSVIGENVIINTCASVDHQCIVGDGAHICPGVRLAGGAKIGIAAWIGIGALVLGGVSVGDGSVIGAGAVVTRDIPSGSLAYGSPAKVKRRVD